MKRFQEQQNRKQCDELWVEVVSENGECQASLGQSIPKALHQVLKLSRS